MPSPLNAIKMQLNYLKTIPNTKDISEDRKLRDAANDFEAIFVQQMLKTMRETSLDSNFSYLLSNHIFVLKNASFPHCTNIKNCIQAFHG